MEHSEHERTILGTGAPTGAKPTLLDNSSTITWAARTWRCGGSFQTKRNFRLWLEFWCFPWQLTVSDSVSIVDSSPSSTICGLSVSGMSESPLVKSNVDTHTVLDRRWLPFPALGTNTNLLDASRTSATPSWTCSSHPPDKTANLFLWMDVSLVSLWTLLLTRLLRRGVNWPMPETLETPCMKGRDYPKENALRDHRIMRPTVDGNKFRPAPVVVASVCTAFHSSAP